MNRFDAGAVLNINVGAIVSNWKALTGFVPSGTEVSAVVKSNSYGLGAVNIAPSLARVGCKTFFVAYLSEGMEVRRAIGPAGRIFVLHGPVAGTEKDFTAYNLIPVLNTLEQVDLWLAYTAALGHQFPCALHFDTGMSRLGFSAFQTEKLFTDAADKLATLNVVLVMSHLANADMSSDAKNFSQLARFSSIKDRITSLLPSKPEFSLSATNGIFLGKDYAFDVVRPGAAIYGIYETDKLALKNVVTLTARILQVQEAKAGQTVGYGASFTFKKDGKIATAALGYGDGFLRSLSNNGFGFIGDKKVPVIGRVSMDLTTFDVSALSDEELSSAHEIEIMGPHLSLSAIAAEAHTISYEVLNSLGQRYFRQYTGEVIAMPSNVAGGEV